MGLEEYTTKRDFGRTPEPSGERGEERAETGLEYVIQKHDASHLHYDFRLELDGVLKSWAVPKGPSLRTGVKRLAMETEDHPLEYGGFEGTIPKEQYGGGTVMLWDRGRWEPEGDPRKGYRTGRLRFRLVGEKLGGEWILTRMKKKKGEKKSSWLLIKSGDEAARDENEPDITEDLPLSVATGRDLAAIAGAEDSVWQSDRNGAGEAASGAGDGAGDRAGGGAGSSGEGSPGESRSVEPTGIAGARKGEPPGVLKAQLARLVSDAPEGDEWVHELKFDGYRVLARVEGGEAQLITRNGKDWTDRFPGVAESLASLTSEAAVLDGEVVVLDDEGRSSFQLLQNSLSGNRAGLPIFYAFDLLYLDGSDLRGATLLDRKERLRPLLATAPRTRVRYSDHVVGNGPEFFEEACRMGVEGMISKRGAAPYRGGRGKDWLKVKCTSRQELVIVGYTDPSGSRVGLGALLLGVHDSEGALVFSGKVGTGFDDRTLVGLEKRLSAMERKTAPVSNPPRGYKARGVHWVRPELVAEIEFTEWTDDGKVRHPSFQGLREDKAAGDVVRESSSIEHRSSSIEQRASESPEREREAIEMTDPTHKVEERGDELRAAGVRISSPDKVLWEEMGVTKRELVEYYVAVEEAVLPRLVDRPLTLVRCPSGAEQNCFFQKHANDSVPELIPRVPIDEEDASELYMYVNGLPSLLGLVQLGVLEFHIWGSRRDRLDRPDRLVFDLDPDTELPFGRIAEGALRLREILSELGLESWPKSSGGKGLHVVVPITRRNSWEEAKGFTQAVARRMVAEEPDAYTAQMSKSKRGGRIFVDYLRNARNSTAIAEYSTRSRPGAPVAVPMAWDEVNARARKPPIFTIRDVPGRLAEGGDPWSGFDSVRQSITKDMLRKLG